MSQQTTIYKDYLLSIKTRTSKTTQNCMYDHESNHFSSKSLKTPEFGNIVRIKDKIQFSNSSSDSNTQLTKHSEQIITRLRPSADGVWIKDTCKRSIEEGGLWVPLGRVGNRSREELKNDDVFRLGKRIYKVLKIQLKDEQSSATVEDEILNAFPVKSVNDSRCRICLAGLQETNLPVINPCGCAGTMGNMHTKCFRMWVCSKLNAIEGKNSLSIAWKSLTCELCNGSLANAMKACEEDVALLNFKKVLVAPFMVVKELSSDENESIKNVHVFGLGKPFQMGRSDETDFQIKDISVSRFHAELSLTNNQVYLQDKGSRFGTLILKGKGIKLNEETLESPWYQIGRTLIRFKLSRPWGMVLPWLKSMIISNKRTQRKVTPEQESRTLDSETDIKTESRSSPDKRSIDKKMDVINEEEEEVDSIEGDDEVREMEQRTERPTMGYLEQDIDSRKELLEEKEKSADSSESGNSSESAGSGDKKRKMMTPALNYSLIDSKFLSPIPIEKNESFRSGSYIDEIQKIRL